MTITIRPAQQTDIAIAAELQLLLWPDHSVEEMRIEMERVILSSEGVVMLAFQHEQPVGFAECRLRTDYVEGTHTCPVGYLEGIYVCENYRRLGVALSLLKSCEKWAKDKNCTEFASDCEVVNQASINFHHQSGFHEVNRIVCFTKKL